MSRRISTTCVVLGMVILIQSGPSLKDLLPADIRSGNTHAVKSDHSRAMHGSDPAISPSPNITAPKPSFIFHLGPPKTATTTIQCGLSELSSSLAEYDYYYLGKSCHTLGAKAIFGNNETNIRGHALRYELMSGSKNQSVYKILEARLKYHHLRSHNVVLSQESFAVGPESIVGWKLLADLLQEWDVTVVLSYRHYFEWILSIYFQQHRNGGKPGPPRLSSQVEFLHHHIWVLQQRHPVTAAMELYQQHGFHNVHIFNIHQEGDLLANFVCQVLPTAKKVCQRLVLQDDNNNISNTTTIRQRQSESFDADKLADYAQEMELLVRRVHQGVVKTISVALTEYRQAHPLEYKRYLNCISRQDSEQLLNMSLVFEQQVLKKKNSASTTTSLVKEFAAFMEQDKFCELNAVRLLEDTNATWARSIIKSVEDGKF